jgi:beta-galactosidase
MNWQGRDRVFLTQAGLVVDGTKVRLSSEKISELSVGIYPAPTGAGPGRHDGVFTSYSPAPPKTINDVAGFSLVRKAGPPREIHLGNATPPVAEEPSDQDFEQAAAWRIQLPKNLDFSTDPILRIRYTGDVARILLNGKFLTDDFYNGNAWDFGLSRYADEIRAGGELQILVLPLRKDAVTGEAKKIFVADSAQPNFGDAASVAEVKRIDIVSRYHVSFPTGAGVTAK